MLASASGALKGVRVLDLTHALAGPFCAQILGDHGADVVKIEPLEGDFFRRMGPYRDDDQLRDFGGLFQSANRNKRSIALDLKSPEGQAVFKKLVAGADALIENFRAGVMDKMGLGYEALKQINPKLVYTSVRGFGDKAGGESPYMQWPAFDIVAQAMGGWMGITGEDADHPVKVGGGAGDTVPGLFAAFGTMTALWHARATGQGQYVDVAMTDSILAMSELVVSHYSYRGVSPEPVGNRIPGLSPFTTVRARDGVIALAAPHNARFADLCRLIGMPELAEDPRYASESSRWEHNDALCAAIETFTVTRTKHELLELMGGKVSCSPIYTAQEIFSDPHYAARDMLPLVEHPGCQDPVAVPGVPVKLSLTPGGVGRRAPLLGEHSREILEEIGLPEPDIERLLQAGTVKAA